MLAILPFSNLGMGSIPARNWVWENSIERGSKRHWILDDNIKDIKRRFKSMRIRCNANKALSCCADFIDRYENVGLAGLNYTFFSIGDKKEPPFRVNAHVYSCLLIQNDLPFRWRGRYNEDTDLCLQVLASGLCTVQFNAFLIFAFNCSFRD